MGLISGDEKLLQIKENGYPSGSQKKVPGRKFDPNNWTKYYNREYRRNCDMIRERNNNFPGHP
jgi:hypothetical protein